MADETTVIEETPAAPGQGSGQGGIKSTLLTAGGVAAGVAIGASVGLFVIGPRLAPASPAHTTATSVGAHGAGAKGSGDETATEGASHTPSPIYLMENLVINPANSGGSRFLLVSVGLAARDEAAVTMLKARDAELRDNILRLFGSKTIEQIADIQSREQLKTELGSQIGKIVPSGTVRRVYFPQFVIQ